MERTDRLTLQQLRYFLAVAETRHFTKAAELVRVAQPSLSKQIQGLEADLGAPLFSRVRGNVTLTEAGETLLPVAHRILADVDVARLAVGELVGLRRGRVRVGATPSLCVSVFADVLRTYHDRYPGIRLLVEEGGSRDLSASLVHGDLDLALVIVPPEGTDPALTTRVVLREDLVVASAANRPPLVNRPAIRLVNLRDRPMVMFRRGYGPRLAVEGGEMDAVLRFVEAGLGVAIVPSMVLAGRPGLRGTPIAPPGLRRTIALAHRNDVPPTNAAKAFSDVLLDYLATKAPRD